MATNLKAIGDRLGSIHPDASRAEFATRMGVHINTLARYERGERAPEAEFLAALVEAGYSADWILTGKGAMRPRGFDEQAGPELPQLGVGVSVPYQIRDGEKDRQERLAPVVAHIRFSEAWLAARGLRAADLSYLEMPDDSMEPTIRKGGLVVVNGGQDLAGDGIYAMQRFGKTVVKRIQRNFEGGGWVRSDNPAYGDLHLDEPALKDLYIWAQAVWAGGEI